MMIFDPTGPGNVVQGMPNGTSNTVIFGERYKDCLPSSGGETTPQWAMHPNYPPGGGHGWDTPVFGWHDMGGASDPSINGGVGIPFQVRPQPQLCVYQVLQGSHTGVMNVLMGDGSVRGVSASVTLGTWIQACNPKVRGTLGSDW